MDLDDNNKPVAAAVIGAITFGVGYNSLAFGWAAVWAIAAMILYWVIIRQERAVPERRTQERLPESSRLAGSARQRLHDLRAGLASASTSDRTPSLTLPGSAATRLREPGQVRAGTQLAEHAKRERERLIAQSR